MTNPIHHPPQHAPITHFPVVGHELTVAGLPLTEVARRAGQTPFYVYDRSVISARVKLLRTTLPRGLSLHYAIKANPHPAIIAHLAGLVDGLDVASGRELALALATGTRPDTISFAGPGKSVEEIAQAVAAGIVHNIESPSQLEQAANAARAQNRQAKIAVRVNPDFELKSSGMKMGGLASPFGVDAEQVPALLKRLAELEQEFVGFHIFWGSQNLNAGNIRDAHDNTFALAYQLAEQAPGPVKLLNIGGGLGIPYFPGDVPLDLHDISANLQRHIDDCKQRLPQAEVVMELGRYLVAEAGLYVCAVRERKVSRGEVFLITDGGLHHHLAATGNFGQLLRKNYPVVLGNRMPSQDVPTVQTLHQQAAQEPAPGNAGASSPSEVVHVVGPLCTPLDRLASNVRLPIAVPGDLVVVFHSGAYGLTASPRAFLGHPDAVELVL